MDSKFDNIQGEFQNVEKYYALYSIYCNSNYVIGVGIIHEAFGCVSNNQGKALFLQNKIRYNFDSI